MEIARIHDNFSSVLVTSFDNIVLALCSLLFVVFVDVRRDLTGHRRQKEWCATIAITRHSARIVSGSIFRPTQPKIVNDLGPI